MSSYDYTSEREIIKERTGCWWVKNIFPFTKYRFIKLNGFWGESWGNNRQIGTRPVLPYSSISSISSNKVMGRNGILELEYGEYPQTVVSKDYSKTLESAYKKKIMKKTNKTYTINLLISKNKRGRVYTNEYEYNGKKYIRFVADSTCEGKILSDGRKIKSGKVYWIEVEPIKWLVDEETNIALSKKILFSGVPYDVRRNYKRYFEKSFMYNYLNTCFINEIKPSKEVEISKKESKQNEIETPKKESKQNEIEILFSEIKKYAKYDLDKDKIYKYLNNLIDDYNQNVEHAISSDGLKLESAESYKMKLIFELNDVLNRQKTLHEKEYNYDQILILLKDYKSILVGNEVSSNDELNSYFVDITKVLSFVDNKELSKEFLDLIETEINRINSFFNDKDKISLEYYNEETFKYHLRTKLHSLLIKLQVNAINKNVMEDIRKIIINDMLEISKENEKSMISFYLKEIKKEVEIIRKIDINNKYCDELNEILNNDINEVKSIDEILKKMTMMLKKLYELEIIIKGNNHEQNCIHNSIKKYKILSKFE